MLPHLRRLLLALLLAATLGLASAGPAAADDPDQSASAGYEVCDSAESSFDYQYLPVERWTGATQEFHVRSNGGITDFAPLQRQLQSGSFVIGDFLYTTTTKFVTWSTQFCPMQSVGGVVDSAAATFGQAMVSSALLTGLVIMTVIALLFQAFRGNRGAGGGLAQQLFMKAGIVALFVIMVAGSSQSRGGGIDGDFDTPYSPGTGSPGWVASTIDRTITQIAAGPASALGQETVLDTMGGGDELDCSTYLGALQDGYQERAAGGQGGLATHAVPAQTVSNLWQISAYNAWSVGQFGNKNLNGHTRVGCRMLDKNASIPVGIGSFQLDGMAAEGNRSTASVTDVMSRIGGERTSLTETAQWVKPDAPAWRPLSNADEDKGWIAWAACVPKDGELRNVTLEDGWSAPAGNSWLIADEAAREDAETPDGSARLNSACHAFFNSSGESVDNIFDWGEGDKELKEHAGEMPASVYDFIGALHGTNQGAGGMAAIAYAIGSIGVFAVFGLLSLSIVVVKVMALAMLFIVFIVMALTLLPNSSNEKLLSYLKQYVGLSLFSAFAVFLLAIITLFVKVIWLLLGNLTGGPNSIMTMLVGGLAPVMAALALHFAFKRVGVPSPMSIQGATGWGQALAGGAATGAVATGMNRLTSGAKNLAASRLKGKALGTAGALNAPRNADTTTSQKSAVALPEAARAAEQGLAATKGSGPTPESILKNPKASAAEKRSAQRLLMREAQQIQAEQREAATANRDAKTETQQGHREDRRERGTALPEGTDRPERPPRDPDQISDRALDLQRWGSELKSGETLRRIGRRVPQAAGGAATLVAAATIGGLPGLGLAAGGMAARSGASYVLRRRREHSAAQQQAIQAYRARPAQPDSGGGRPAPGGLHPSRLTLPRQAPPVPRRRQPPVGGPAPAPAPAAPAAPQAPLRRPDPARAPEVQTTPVRAPQPRSAPATAPRETPGAGPFRDAPSPTDRLDSPRRGISGSDDHGVEGS